MDFARYIAANAAYVDLLKQAGQCKALFVEAGAAVPEELRLFLGGSRNSHGARGVSQKREPMKVKPPSHPFRDAAPTLAGEDWIAVPEKAANLSTLILALLRTEKLPTLGDLQDAVRKRQPKTVPNSVYNAVNRLVADGIVSKDGSELALNKLSNAPILHHKFVWGHPDLMGDPDRAHFRRKTILDLISENPGVEAMQMVRTLAPLLWFPRKFNKDTLKGDLQALEGDRKIRRSSEGHGWVAVAEKEVPSKEKTS